MEIERGPVQYVRLIVRENLTLGKRVYYKDI